MRQAKIVEEERERFQARIKERDAEVGELKRRVRELAEEREREAAEIGRIQQA